MAVMTLKFEQCGFTVHLAHPKDADRMENMVDQVYTVCPDLNF